MSICESCAGETKTCIKKRSPKVKILHCVEFVSKDEHLLRYWLWRFHAVDHYLYGDDGEMQCSQCMLDFKRDSVDKINEKLEQNQMDWTIENADKINKMMEDVKISTSSEIEYS